MDVDPDRRRPAAPPPLDACLSVCAPAACRPSALALAASPSLPDEIGFLASFGIEPAILHAAAMEAQAHAITPDSALLAAGEVTEDFFYRAFAFRLGAGFIDGEAVLDAGTRYPGSIFAGIAPLSRLHPQIWLAAPRGRALTALLGMVRNGRLSPSHIAITTPSNLSRLVLALAARDIVWQASQGLGRRDPSLSAETGPSAAQRGFAVAASLASVIGFAMAPELSAYCASVGMGCLFLPAILLRLFAGAASAEPRKASPRDRIPDHRLPTYSIIVALHREARVVAHLTAALDAIDYPRGKLDIKLVLEADDEATRRALEALPLSAAYEIIIAPPGAPRTKPRALNVALPLLRGDFVAVFDAEDVPEPRQLREAAERFLRAPRTLACLQASLEIDNIEDSWLTRLFAIEYALLFDVLHQGMAGLSLPIPLGGSSNHFRTSVLREVGGWDAWNVTEDADLGLRLARYGYRTSTLASSTHEEAPARLSAWVRQRRRWSKGWMQTFITLSRDPRRLLREVGLAEVAVLVMMMTALVIVPPLWPFFAAFIAYDLLASGWPSPTTLVGVVQATLWVSVALFGAGSMIWLVLLGMKRRDLLGLWPYLPLLVPYHFLMSVAAWAALYDLALRPFHWHKTEHGLAKSSRLKARVAAE